MPTNDKDDIARRIMGQAKAGGSSLLEASELLEDPLAPRWRIDARVVEFECGCRGERCLKVFGAKNYDPIIFRDLPQQAVYDYVCERHLAGMNTIVKFGGYVDFAQWVRHRRRALMGKVL